MFLWSIGRWSRRRKTWRKIRRTIHAAANRNYLEVRGRGGLADAFEVFSRGKLVLSSCRSYNCSRGPNVRNPKPSVSTWPASKHFNYLCRTSSLSLSSSLFLSFSRSLLLARAHRFLPFSRFSPLGEWLSDDVHKPFRSSPSKEPRNP